MHRQRNLPTLRDNRVAKLPHGQERGPAGGFLEDPNALWERPTKDFLLSCDAVTTSFLLSLGRSRFWWLPKAPPSFSQLESRSPSSLFLADLLAMHEFVWVKICWFGSLHLRFFVLLAGQCIFLSLIYTHLEVEWPFRRMQPVRF